MTWAPNIGHGHVFPRADGVKARCGGPTICGECGTDKARKDELALPAVGLAMAEPNDFIVALDLRTDAGRNAAFMYAGAIERAAPEAAEALRARIQRFAQGAR